MYARAAWRCHERGCHAPQLEGGRTQNACSPTSSGLWGMRCQSSAACRPSDLRPARDRLPGLSSSSITPQHLDGRSSVFRAGDNLRPDRYNGFGVFSLSQNTYCLWCSQHRQESLRFLMVKQVPLGLVITLLVPPCHVKNTLVALSGILHVNHVCGKRDCRPPP